MFCNKKKLRIVKVFIWLDSNAEFESITKVLKMNIWHICALMIMVNRRRNRAKYEDQPGQSLGKLATFS